MNKQTTYKFLMIRPSKFYFNTETAVNNAYQKNLEEDPKIVEAKALVEFDNLAKKIKDSGMEINIIQDTPIPYTPDSIFPNNWFSSHSDDKVVIYPMFAPNRRLERQKFLEELIVILNDKKLEIIDLTSEEKTENFLEGTGALVLDRVNKIAYCSLSQRAHLESLNLFCKMMGYKPISFQSTQTFPDGKEIIIYHTNVMMMVGEDFAVICSDVIKNLEERETVLNQLKLTNKEIIDISQDQVLKFAGNLLEVRNKSGKRYTLMSKSAHDALTPEQLKTISKSSEIIYSDITTIETYGGGSVRCMIA
ncbi:MAG: arginine deiminase-related protein, partial [Cetobacterium sp.]